MILIIILILFLYFVVDATRVLKRPAAEESGGDVPTKSARSDSFSTTQENPPLQLKQGEGQY